MTKSYIRYKPKVGDIVIGRVTEVRTLIVFTISSKF